MTRPRMNTPAIRLILLLALMTCAPKAYAQSYTLAPAPFQYVLATSGAIIPNGCVWTFAAGTTSAIATYADTSGTPNGNPIIADNYGRFVAYLLPGTNYKFQYESTPCAAPSTHGAILKVQDNIQGTPAAAANVDIVGTAGTTLTAGQCAFLSDGSGGNAAGQWYKCESANAYSATLPEVGIPIANIVAATQGTIRIAGYVTGLSSLVVGSTYYAGTAGAITTTAPANARVIGAADTASSLVVTANPSTSGTGFADDFRLSLSTGTCVTTADVTAATTIFLTPCNGNRLTLFDSSSRAAIYTTAEISIAVPATTSQMYDVWAFANSGTPALELLAWTNDTTRATALARVNGRWTKSGDPTRLYVGSVRTTTVSGQTEDSNAKRYVWNYYNRVRRAMRVKESTDSWPYTLAVLRQANGSAANQLDCVVGVAESPISVRVLAAASNTNTGVSLVVGIGEDSTTTLAASATNSAASTALAAALVPLAATLETVPAVGRHIYTWLEFSAATGTTTWYGDNGGTVIQSGISGFMEG